MNVINEKANQVGGILESNYDRLKYDPRFTLWGVCFYWDPFVNTFKDNPTQSGLGDVITNIFERAKRKGARIFTPHLSIPLSRDEQAHYSLLSMKNRDLVTHGFMNLLSTNNDRALDIADDVLLTNEALETYVQLRQSGDLTEKVGLTDFLIHYVSGQPFVEGEKPRGQFRPLLERLSLRYEGRDFIEGVVDFTERELYDRVVEFHNISREAKLTKIDSELLDAFSGYSNGDEEIIIPRDDGDESLVTLKQVLTKKRVRTSNGWGQIVDWDEYSKRYLENRSTVTLDPNRVLESQLVNLMIDKYFPLYKEDAESTLALLREEKEKSGNKAQQKALNTTLKLLLSLGMFDGLDTINHTMVIARQK